MEKKKRKRIVKPVAKPVFKPLPEFDNTEKVSEPVISDKPDELELISVPVPPDAITSCDGCYFYEETEEKCNDKEGRDCTGIIFVKE